MDLIDLTNSDDDDISISTPPTKIRSVTPSPSGTKRPRPIAQTNNVGNLRNFDMNGSERHTQLRRAHKPLEDDAIWENERVDEDNLSQADSPKSTEDTIDLTNSDDDDDDDDDISIVTPPTKRHVVTIPSTPKMTRPQPLHRPKPSKRLQYLDSLRSKLYTPKRKTSKTKRPRSLTWREQQRRQREDDRSSFLRAIRSDENLRNRTTGPNRIKRESVTESPRHSNNNDDDTSQSRVRPSQPEINRTVAELRSKIRRRMKQRLGVTAENAPGSFRVILHEVTSPVFAALVGRGDDPDLDGLERKGSYITTSVKTSMLLDRRDEDIQETIVEDDDGLIVCLNGVCTVWYKPSEMLLWVDCLRCYSGPMLETSMEDRVEGIPRNKLEVPQMGRQSVKLMQNTTFRNRFKQPSFVYETEDDDIFFPLTAWC